MPPIREPVDYESRLDVRALEQVDSLVIHCTELPDLAVARHYAERVQYPATRTGACGHYYVGKHGELLEYVAPERIAHHCVGYNQRSIGIELDNLGRYPDWLHTCQQGMTDPYPEQQIAALLALIDHLLALLPGLRWIAGHEELDIREVPATDDAGHQVRRKRDPGPLFPWPRLQVALAGRLQHAIPPPPAPDGVHPDAPS